MALSALAGGSPATNTGDCCGVADWHPADIMAALRKADPSWTLSALSRAHGYSRNAVGEALRRPWPAVEAIIADALGVTPREIWPTRYDAAGTPRNARPIR